MSLFLNRQAAGQELSKALKQYSNQPNTLVLGMPHQLTIKNV